MTIKDTTYSIITCPNCYRESFTEEGRIVECCLCGHHSSMKALRLMRPWGPPHCIKTFCRPATEEEIERERNLSKAEWCIRMAELFAQRAIK